MKGGLARLYQLADGNAINRRQLLELFYQSARRMGSIDPLSIADSTLVRGDFDNSCFEDYYFDYITSGHHVSPTDKGIVPGCSVEINALDGPFEGVLYWSLGLTVASVEAHTVYAWPTVGSQALWSAGRRLQPAAVADYHSAVGTPDPYNDKESSTSWAQGDLVSLSGEGSCIVGHGQYITGLMIIGNGAFRVTHASLAARRRAR